eukprot:comp23609_c2_seq1/m.40149 comp23609_c2_seq1/g.40149  ORF comp23609_c2_seq1/g.40149 comp23609_c2_seq1/m.40149 type:complete len:781 (-) comp23609_c2_seq1:156-2498(-)
MSAYLPHNLLLLFQPRPELPYLEPLDKLPCDKVFPPYTGIAQYVGLFEDPSEAPPQSYGETGDERRARKRQERLERAAAELQQAKAEWDPAAANVAKTMDPYKTLFVGRTSYDTTESRLRRELEQYGPIVKVAVVHSTEGKPRGYAFVEFEHERDMRSAYKHAEGMKIDGRRILVDVERGRTVKGWLPRRLGGGLGGTRRGGDDVNIKHGGREASQGNVATAAMSDHEDRRDRDRRDSHAASRDRGSDRRPSYRDVDRPAEDRDRDRERDRDRDRGREERDRGEKHEEEDEETYKARVEAQMEDLEEDEDAIIERQRHERQKRLAQLATGQSPGIASTTSSVFTTPIPTNPSDFATPQPRPTSTITTTTRSSSNLNPAKGGGQGGSKEGDGEGEEKKPHRVSVPAAADMFAEEAEGFGQQALHASGLRPLLDESTHLTDNWDDAEGYYRTRSGEMLGDRYKVFGSSGQGVFSSVVRAHDTKDKDREVAIKIIRNNEHMEKAGQKEMECLLKLMKADPEDKHHIVRVLGQFTHRNHLCIVFEGLQMNLRELLRKYGKGVGLSIQAVRTYAHQLLLALRLMNKTNLIHADIKPDNILVNDKKTVLKLADLGSAIYTSEAEVTPLLVSRYYRAPEVMLGVPYGTPLDLWSVACTLYELYTGSILFPGKTNNDMLRLQMELKGKISRKLYLKAACRAEHFDDEFNFLFEDTDKVTGNTVIRKMPVINQTDSIAQLVSGRSSDQYREWEGHLADLLDKMLILDPSKRITITQALQHPFIAYKLAK